MKCGGYTTARLLEQDDLDVWAHVLALPDTAAEFAAKGTPKSVQTAVVSGLKFKFAFEDGREKCYIHSESLSIDTDKYIRYIFTFK